MFRKEEQKSLNPTPRPNTRGVKEKNSQYFERAISLADTRESKVLVGASGEDQDIEDGGDFAYARLCSTVHWRRVWGIMEG